MNVQAITATLTKVSRASYGLGIRDFGVMGMGIRDFGVMKMGIRDFGVMQMGIRDFGVMTPILQKAA